MTDISLPYNHDTALRRSHSCSHSHGTSCPQHQVPSEYHMPPSLQRTEDISKLPLPQVDHHLLQHSQGGL